MKQFILFLAFVTLGSGATFEPGLRIKFGVGMDIGKSFFYDMPRTVTKAVEMGWSKTNRPTSPLPTLVMYCNEYKIVCCLYDPDTQFIGGLNIALPTDQFSDAVFDFATQGFIPWTVPGVNGNPAKNFITKQIYFISEEILLKSKTERMTAAKENRIYQEDVVRVTGFYGKQMAIPRTAAGIVKTGFTKQNCIPFMGTHYFYNMTTQSECKSDAFLNWFTLVDSDNVIGIGLVVPGVMPEKSGEPFYFERPAKAAVTTILKTYPKCLADIAEKPTITTMHVYFIEKPWTVGCLPW